MFSLSPSPSPSLCLSLSRAILNILSCLLASGSLCQIMRLTSHGATLRFWFWFICSALDYIIDGKTLRKLNTCSQHTAGSKVNSRLCLVGGSNNHRLHRGSSLHHRISGCVFSKDYRNKHIWPDTRNRLWMKWKLGQRSLQRSHPSLTLETLFFCSELYTFIKVCIHNNNFPLNWEMYSLQ